MERNHEQAHYGTLEQLEDGRWQLHYTRRLAHPVEKVWQAITEPEHLAAWFPTTIDGERAPGAALRFTFAGGQAPPFDGRMLAYEPTSLMEFAWGPDVIRLTLHADGNGETVLELFDTLEDRGKAARDGAGWHTCLDGLRAHVDGAEAPREAMGQWKHVHTHYVESFGPEAAKIGPPEGFD
jgi:uncharacterized protein YndB with AHSA1/START domain